MGVECCANEMFCQFFLTKDLTCIIVVSLYVCAWKHLACLYIFLGICTHGFCSDLGTFVVIVGLYLHIS